MATSVSVRELKNRAPRLVRLAAGGERFVITRYGRPQAELAPLSEPASAPPRHRARMQAWERERRAFERRRRDLAHRYGERFVAVSGGRVVGVDADHDALFQRLWRKLAGRPLFIGWVGAEEPSIELPGFMVE